VKKTNGLATRAAIKRRYWWHCLTSIRDRFLVEKRNLARLGDAARDALPMTAEPKVVYEFGPFRVDPDKQLLSRENQPVAVTPKAFETLLALIRRSREVVTKDELMQAVWPDAFVEEANLSQNIFLLRKALGDTPEDHRYIVTLPGRGYRFAAPVHAVTGDGEALVIEKRSRAQMVVEEIEAQPSPTVKSLWRTVSAQVSWKVVFPVAA
jgi:DNA-binding winged helix-turn-helix (wHTH) protein